MSLSQTRLNTWLSMFNNNRFSPAQKPCLALSGEPLWSQEDCGSLSTQTSPSPAVAVVHHLGSSMQCTVEVSRETVGPRSSQSSGKQDSSGRECPSSGLVTLGWQVGQKVGPGSKGHIACLCSPAKTDTVPISLGNSVKGDPQQCNCGT